MIRDILYLIVYFITETVLYSLAYRTVLSRGITNKAVRWMIYIIAVVITGSIVYVNNNLQYVMGASIFIMVMLPVFIIEPFNSKFDFVSVCGYSKLYIWNVVFIYYIYKNWNF